MSNAAVGYVAHGTNLKSIASEKTMIDYMARLVFKEIQMNSFTFELPKFVIRDQLPHSFVTKHRYQ